MTEPIFDALFGDYDFVKNNVVSKSLNEVMTTFKQFGFEKEQKHIRSRFMIPSNFAYFWQRICGRKQKLIVTLHDKFFQYPWI
ncbi:hypothetical protein ACW185_10600 [Limosilactobacillus fermentum]